MTALFLTGPRVLLALIVLACAGWASAQASPRAADAAFDGAWRGTLEVGAASLRLQLDIEAGAGAASGVLTSLDQGGAPIPLSTLDLDRDTIRFAASAVGLSYEGVRNGDRIEGRLTQSGAAFDLAFERGAFERARPAAAPEPDAEIVTVDAGPARLVGVLRRPEGEGPFPAVVILSGSGPQTRDGVIAGQPVYAALADGLARAGVASLRLDDRGTGESTGPEPHAPADLAEDAAAALARLRAEPDIACAGFAGHSEGAVLALLAARDAAPAFIVSLAGMHLGLEETLVGQAEAVILAEGGTPAQVEANRGLQEAMFAVLRDRSPGRDLRAALEAALLAAGAPQALADSQAAIWGRPYAAASFQLDPAALAAAYDGPMLAVFAETDTQILARPHSTALARARGAAPTDILVAPGVNHLFQAGETGAPSEYGAAGRPMAPEALELIGRAVADLAGEACGAN